MQTAPLQGSPGTGRRGGDEAGGSASMPCSDRPFSDSINPQALYPHEAFQDVLAALAQAKISDREGATLITGAAGAGKTSLIARLLSESERAEGSLRLAGSEDLTFSRFLKLCAEGFGLPAEFANAKDHMKALSAFLVERARSGRSSTIVIDPADNLNARFLGELSEFATWNKAGRRLSNVILTGLGTPGGQAGPKFAGVKLALHCHLQPLSAEEVRPYLAHHLRIAGASRPDLLAPEVVARMAEISGCLPGAINKLARAALWAAPTGSGVEITPELVEDAAHLIEAGAGAEGDAAGRAKAVAKVQPPAPRPQEPAADLPVEAAATAADEGAMPKDEASAVQSEADVPSEMPEDWRDTATVAALKPARPRRARRFWLGLGASGLAAGLLLAAAVDQTWPEKIVGLLDDYAVNLPSIGQLAESFGPDGDSQSALQNPADKAGTLPVAAQAQPLLTFTADVGREDEPLRLQVAGLDGAGAASSPVAVTIAGLPPGARLSAGTRDNTGLWHLKSDELTDLTLLPPTDYAGNFGLAISVASPQADGEVTYATQAMPIYFKAVPDVPLLRVGQAEGEAGEPVPLDIEAELVDKDGSEILTLFISDLPEGARLSAGTHQGDGSWLLEPQELTGLRLIPLGQLSGSFILTVMALASERDGGSVPAKLPLTVTVLPGAAAPELTLAPVAGRQDEPLPLALAASPAQDSGPVDLYLLLKGLPAGARLSAGRDIGDAVWRVEAADMAGLKILPPAGWSGGFDLEVTAVALSAEGGETSVTDKAPVRFDPAPVASGPAAEAAPRQAEAALQADSKLPPATAARQAVIGEDFDISQGDALLAAKDLAAARQYFQQAVDRGIAKAMTALGVTYDPNELTRLGISDSESDVSMARHWYLRGVAAGDLAAMTRLQALTSKP